MRRLMTLDDLYNYYSTQGQTLKFSCENEETIVVQVPGNLQFEKDTSSTDGLYPTRLKMCFVGDNLNGSRIEKKAMENALSSSKFRPILGFIHEVDGEPQFYGHNMHVDDDNKLIYDEVPVGVITEEASLEYDEEHKKDYAVANGYIYEEYSSAADILKRDNQCDVSVELSIRELSYNAEDKILCLDNFYFSGCTILGVDEFGHKVNPAMPGSNISLSDFSVQNNSFCASVDQDKLIETLEKLNTTLSNFNIQNSKEGGKIPMFNELLEKYGKTVEDISFEYEEMSDEELEIAFAEAFAEPESDEGESGEAPAPEEEFAESESEEPETEVEPEAEDTMAVKYSVCVGENKKEFSVSLSEKIYAMNQLVNDTYGELDGDYYDVDVFEEDNIVEMYSYWTGKAYRQSFKCKKDKYSLVGDRVEIFAKYLTQDEITALENMKANYSTISEKLQKYEEEPQKMEILSSAKYGYVAGTEEFEALKNEHFDLSIEDVTSKANEILLSYAEQGALKFSVEPEDTETVGSKTFAPVNKTTQGRYGTLFSK